ncbi:helix-turn-helix transcriptional regulator [Mesobacillus foraminis]|uniref:helix-turn-helix transcriptional regulator n=1 Tax=Mesobacillus foraminis TaxID=279826 RepID=UPI000EF54EF2|nr:helix-turn-helix transcriptional regulator [Mesobacillus foraminis]
MKNNLVEYRKKYGYSQDRRAGTLGVSRQTIISIEKGKYNPSLPLAIIMAKLFETRVEDIFLLEEEDYVLLKGGKKK